MTKKPEKFHCHKCMHEFTQEKLGSIENGEIRRITARCPWCGWHNVVREEKISGDAEFKE